MTTPQTPPSPTSLPPDILKEEWSLYYQIIPNGKWVRTGNVCDGAVSKDEAFKILTTPHRDNRAIIFCEVFKETTHTVVTED
jgi:hypothetical protein